jgi:hypothetical protein
MMSYELREAYDCSCHCGLDPQSPEKTQFNYLGDCGSRFACPQ